jgi:hypothetical protein
MAHSQMVPINPIDELSIVGEGLKEYVSTKDDAILEMTVARINRAPTFWGKFFKTAVNREQDKIALDWLRTGYKDRRSFIDCYVGIQLEIARRRGDALVMATAVDLQAKLAAFAAEKMNEFTETILASKDAIYAKSAAHWRSLEQYRDVPPVYERACQSCDTEIAAYLDWVQALRRKFTDALTAKVGKE